MKVAAFKGFKGRLKLILSTDQSYFKLSILLTKLSISIFLLNNNKKLLIVTYFRNLKEQMNFLHPFFNSNIDIITKCLKSVLDFRNFFLHYSTYLF